MSPMIEKTTGAAALTTSVLALTLALVVAPTDAFQGESQRLMYVHVPAAWTAYLSFAVVAGASALYLIRRDLRHDRVAQAAAELGVGLTALAIVLGSLWARPTWGTWWTWDPRLVTTVVLLLVYLGYLGVRGLSTDPEVNARRSAVIGLLALVNVPLVHFSVVWWRTLHQPPSVLRPGGPAACAAGDADEPAGGHGRLHPAVGLGDDAAYARPGHPGPPHRRRRTTRSGAPADRRRLAPEGVLTNMGYMIAGYLLTLLFWLGHLAWVMRTRKHPR